MADHDLTAALRLAGQLQPAIERGERATLVQVIRELVALGAPMGGQWPSIAQIAATVGEIDLSRAAAKAIGILSRGVANVRAEVLLLGETKPKRRRR